MMAKFSTPRTTKRLARRMIRKEDGGMTVLGLYLTATMFILGGLAVDVAYLISSRTQLQVAADIVAHSALFTLDNEEDHDIAKQKALAMASSAMPKYLYGEVIKEDDIVFGTYNAATTTFTADPASREAVLVRAFRVSERSNTIASFILRMVGQDQWDMVVPSVFETYRPTCFREGFVADGVVDIQSNNAYTNGFCIHSNQHVSVNQNNTWETGTIVSMPNTGDLDLPRSGFEKNEGLVEALRPGRYQMHVLNRMQRILDGMTDDRSRYYRSDYVNSDVAKTVTASNKMDVSDFHANKVNVMYCGNKGVSLEPGTYSNMVIIGYGCDFSMKNGVALENMTLITTSTDDKSISAPNGFRMGQNDSCGDGGGAQIITWGGFSVASGLEMYGSQLIAAGPIDFAANANGIEGASMVSGETIDGTSNMSFGFCGSGMDNVFEAEYFRMRA